MVRICGQNLLALHRQYIRPLDPASARKGSICVYMALSAPALCSNASFCCSCGMRSRKSAFFRGFLLVIFVDKSLFLHDNNTAHTETHHVGCHSANRDFGFYAYTTLLCRARYLFHSVGGLCLLRRYAAKPQKRSDAKTHGFIFIDGAFCVWQNIIRLYYAVTRQNSGVQLSAARKPAECTLVKREACVETWLRWIGLRH